MAHRLTRIYTRTGDDGTTGLGDGQRVAKHDPRVEAIGDVDELNSVIGLLACEDIGTGLAQLLAAVQNDLFDLGAELCIPGHEALSPGRPDELEALIDAYNADLPPLKEFILPGGSRGAAVCHLARTVCRRAERRMALLHQTSPVSAAARTYINRLSDLLFVLGRVINRHQKSPDVFWQPGQGGKTA